MAEKEKSGSSEGVWAAVGAIGGLIGGGAAVVALFMAKPETITLVVPPQTLQQVAVDAERKAQPAGAPATAEMPAPQSAQTVVATTVAPLPAPPTLETRDLGGGLSASLVSIAETSDSFVANLRIANGGAADKMLAVRGSGYSGQFNLSDNFGGSCPWHWAANQSPGTIRPASLNPAGAGPPHDLSSFTSVPAGGSAVHTLLFHKDRCDSAPSGDHPVNLSGSFVVIDGDARREATVAFENVAVAQGG